MSQYKEVFDAQDIRRVLTVALLGIMSKSLNGRAKKYLLSSLKGYMAETDSLYITHAEGLGPHSDEAHYKFIEAAEISILSWLY